MYRSAALSIAGSDSGGGAGIQADLAAFAAFDTFGTTAVTAVTAQNPQGVTAVDPVAAEVVSAQIDAVVHAFAPAAVKTGMLFNAEIIRAVADRLRCHCLKQVVVDPVMVATSGARLLQEQAVAALQEDLLPLADVITPNLPEAAILSGRDITTEAEATTAAVQLARRYACWVMIKGGHRDESLSTDILTDGEVLITLACTRVNAPTTHGTGCSLSAAMAACLARGMNTPDAAVQAKAYVLGRLQACCEIHPGTWVMQPPDLLPVGIIDTRTESCRDLESP